MRKPKKITATVTVRVRPEISQSLDKFATENGYYVYEAFEKLIEAGLKSFGTSVAKLNRGTKRTHLT